MPIWKQSLAVLSLLTQLVILVPSAGFATEAIDLDALSRGPREEGLTLPTLGAGQTIPRRFGERGG